MNRVKVLHLRSSAHFVGLERLLLQLVEPMRRKGYEIEFLVLYRKRKGMPPVHPLVEEARRRGIKAEQVEDRSRFSPAIISHIAHRLREGRFSLLHTHDYKTDLLGLIAARWVGVRNVATVHGYVPVSRRVTAYKIMDLFALRFFSKVLTVSVGLHQQLISAGVPERKVLIAPNVIDVQEFTSRLSSVNRDLRRQLGIPEDSHVVSVIGRLIVGKGHRCFLESVQRILDTLPGTRFLIVGDGPLGEELRNFSVALGIQPAISFLGFREDIADLMAISDVIVLPSLEEGSPYVLLEALSLAKPVVATRVGGVPEMVEHGETGLLVPPGDPVQLAKAILHLLRNPEEARRLGRRGREVIIQRFCIERLVRKLAEVYREVLSGAE